MNIEIANRLVILRKEKGFSQEQLAEKIGVSRQAVSKWERSGASPDTDNLIMLARLYEVSLDELLRTEDEIPQPELEAKEPAEEITPAAEITEESAPEPAPAEQTAEQAPSYDKISKKLSVMSDIAWFKVIVFIVLAFMSFFVTPPFGFLMAAFAVITIFSLIDAVHFRDFGKFKMWAALLMVYSVCLFKIRYLRDFRNETMPVLLAIPAYEAIVWIIRRIKKKKSDSKSGNILCNSVFLPKTCLLSTFALFRLTLRFYGDFPLFFITPREIIGVRGKYFPPKNIVFHHKIC